MTAKLEYLQPPRKVASSTRAETPYLKAKQEWDERIGTNVKQAYNWRLAFFSASFLSILLAITLLSVINQRQVIPIFVGLDKERGEPVVLGRADEQKVTTGKLEIQYFLSEFVKLVRSVPADKVLVRENWTKAYAYLKPEAAKLLSATVGDDPESPLKKIGTKFVSVRPVSVVPIPNTSSYQARWEERVYDNMGQKLDEYSMLGTFSLEVIPPKDLQTLSNNPLGIFITNFSWARELK